MDTSVDQNQNYQFREAGKIVQKPKRREMNRIKRRRMRNLQKNICQMRIQQGPLKVLDGKEDFGER